MCRRYLLPSLLIDRRRVESEDDRRAERRLRAGGLFGMAAFVRTIKEVYNAEMMSDNQKDAAPVMHYARFEVRR